MDWAGSLTKSYGSASVSSPNSLNTVVNSFLNSVIQTYGNGQAIKIPGNISQGKPQNSFTGNMKTQTGQSISLEKKIFRRLRKFSKKSVENMMKMSNLGQNIGLANVKTLRRVLTRGIQGRNVAR